MNHNHPDGTDQSKTCNCNCGTDKKCSCWHHKVAPIAIALIGVVFLLQAFGMMSFEMTAMLWPILLIIAAGTKAFGHNCKCC